MAPLIVADVLLDSTTNRGTTSHMHSLLFFYYSTSTLIWDSLFFTTISIFRSNLAGFPCFCNLTPRRVDRSPNFLGIPVVAAPVRSTAFRQPVALGVKIEPPPWPLTCRLWSLVENEDKQGLLPPGVEGPTEGTDPGFVPPPVLSAWMACV